MADGTSSHKFKIELDISNVISGLSAVDATATRITENLNKALKVPETLPTGTSARDVGVAAGSATRSAVESFQKSTGISDPAILREFRNNFSKALKDAYAPLLKDLATQANGKVSTQNKDYGSGFKSVFGETEFKRFISGIQSQNPVLGPTKAPIETLTPAQKDQNARQAASVKKILDLEEKLGKDIHTYDQLMELSSQARRELLNGLEDEKNFQDQQAKARRSLLSRERVREEGPGVLASGDAAAQANFFQIKGEAADILRKGDNGDLQAIITGKKQIADLTAKEAAEVSALLANDEESVELSAQAVIARKRLKQAVDSRVAELSGPKAVSDASLFDINKRVAQLIEGQARQRIQEASVTRPLSPAQILAANKGVDQFRAQQEANRIAESTVSKPLSSSQLLAANKGLAGFQSAAQAKREAELAAEETRKIVEATITKPLTPAQLLAANKGISSFSAPRDPGLVSVSSAALLRANQGVARLIAPTPEPALQSVTSAQLLAANRGVASFGAQPELQSVTTAQLLRANKGLSEFGRGTELSAAQIIRINRGLAESQRLVSLTPAHLLRANQGIASFGTIKNPVTPAQLTAINKNLSNFGNNLTQITGALTPGQIFAINKNLAALQKKSANAATGDPFLVGPVNKPLSPQEQATASLNAERSARQVELLKQKGTGPADTSEAAAVSLGRERIARQKELAVLEGRTASDYRAMGSLAAARLSAQNQLKTAEFRELRSNEEFMRARAERLVEERKYNHEQRKINAQVAREQGFGGSSALARFLGKFGSGNPGGGGSGSSTGGIPPTLGEFFGHGAANIARYAIPSAIGYGALNGIQNTIKEAEELDRIFAQVESQFDATFGPEKAGPKFASFRKEILQIAKDTGVAGEEIALIGFQLQGAFGEGTDVSIAGRGGGTGQELVTNQLRASAEISKVTGLSSSEITDSLTAASLAFDVSFRRIGDITLQLQDRFGVLAKQIIPFLGDIAPVAKEAGFTLEEFATIAAVTQQKSGKAGSALAEAYGRVIPAIAQARSQLLQLAQTNTLSPETINTIASGSIKDVFFAIADSFTSLNQESKDFVINLLGGRREAQSILAAFNDSDKLASAINQTNSAGNILQERFDKIATTLTESLARVKEQFRQLGVQVYEGGLGDALKALVQILGVLTTALGGVFSIFGKINDATDGWAAKVVALAIAYKILAANISLNKDLSTTFLAGGLGSGLTRGPNPTQILAQGGSFIPGPNGGSFVNASGQPIQNRGSFKESFNRGTFGQIGLVAATTLATGLAQYYSSAKDKVDESKQLFASLTEEELKKRLLNSKDPFSGGAWSDFWANQRRGLLGQNFDPRKLMQDELNRRAFDKTGAAPVTFQQARDGVVTVADLGASDNISAAFNDKNVFSSVAKRIDFLNTDPTLQKTKNGLAAYTLKAGAQAGDVGEALKITDDLLSNKEELQKAALERIKELAKTNAGYANLLLLLETPEAKDFIAKEATKTDAQVSVEASKTTVENAESSYAVGSISVERLISVYQEQENALQYVLGTLTDKTSKAYQDTLDAVNALQKKKNSTYTSNKSNITSLRSEIAQIGTGDTDASKNNEIDLITADLRDPNFLDKDGRLSSARKVIQLLQQLDGIQTVPDEVRTVLAEAIYDPAANQEWSRFLELYKLIFGNLANAKIKEIFIAAALGNGSLDEVLATLKQKKSELVAANTAAALAGDYNAAQSTADIDAAIDYVTKEQGKAQIPVKTAGKNAKDTADKLREAKQDFLKALIEGDPVKLAALAVQQADEDYAAAGNDEALQYKALAAKVRAVRQLQAAKFDVGTSQRELNSALAAYKGDTLAVANLAVEDAIRQRDEVNRLFETGGAGEADKNRAEVALIQAKANARDAQLASQKDDYQFLYDMGQITKSQFIQYLQTLKQIPDLTTQQIRDLDRQIKQLSGELSQDLQFNLPTKFKLPTLYETRRINQSGSSQAGYVDNRNVTIQINVNDGSGQQQMLQVLNDVVGGGARVAGNRKY